MRIVIIIFLITIFEPCFSQTKISKINWDKDIEFLRNELPKNHKDFFFLKSEESFNIGLDIIKSQKDNLSNLEITLRLQP